MASSSSVLDLKLDVNLDAWFRRLGGFASQVLPRAAFALNGKAMAARDTLRDEAKRVFDRPTDFTIKYAFGYTSARLSSFIELSFPEGKFLEGKAWQSALWIVSPPLRRSAPILSHRSFRQIAP
jgi:hypothetical protein